LILDALTTYPVKSERYLNVPTYCMEHSYLSQEKIYICHLKSTFTVYFKYSLFVGCSIYNENSNVLDMRRLIMDTKKIGAFIALNRKKKGYIQEQLAEKLGVTNKTISRWEIGHYMPDLSLLEPLSKELDITLNELLTGEEIIKEEVVEYSEKNLIQTIDYTDKRIKNEHKKISIFIIGLGIFTSLCAFTIFPSESSWGSIYSIIGLFLFIIGVFRELKITSLLKKGFISVLLFVILLSTFFILDYVSVTQFKQPPIYRFTTTTVFSDDGNKMIEYQNPFYNVFRINVDTPNEYYLIDDKKQYTIDTVPTSPFNMDKSSMEQLKHYKSQYIGDNSNTSHLLSALPLSEYGYVFEIDSENCGLLVNYNCTDWYNNENLYIHKALIYNSVSLFKLIDNLETITFNFSGNSYTITRKAIEKYYPVDQKINDNEFVCEMMKLFEVK
jgi:transcriptional regulator with XRE-family HTH domain